jgi:transcriptional regulator with XRE-family HTH domain
MGGQMEKATKRTSKREKPLEFAALGKRLRSARRQRKMRLKDVAEMVGCSESMLSKIECDRVQPSLQMLHRISTVLDTSIGNLFGEQRESNVEVYRKGKRPIVVISGDDSKPRIRLERLAPHFDDQQIDGNIHMVEPGANNGGEIKHLGQEIGYVLEGQIELVIGDQRYHLTEGDSFFFKSDLPHSYQNVGKKLARVIWINTPPTF